jgi:uncharacterized protein (DUF1015 family)
MAQIRSFSGIHFNKSKFISGPAGVGDVSGVISPPFDVLDAPAKARLQAKHPHNIVNVDLPHIPPKAAGPADVYERSAVTLKAWLDAHVLTRETRTAFYPYMQTYTYAGRNFHRRGFFALVRLSPFGEGQVVPHERTYKGAIEDRLALMKSTGAQLSPIFGLFNDRGNEVTHLLYAKLGKPELSGTLDGVKHDLWKISDPDLENAVSDKFGGKPVYIADGHHRYTTALEYQKWMIENNGGRPLAPNHPANWCMFVLISMNDDGLMIFPTHRVIGGLENFSVEALRAAVGNNVRIKELLVPPDQVDEYAERTLPNQGSNVMGLYDGREKKLYQLGLVNLDVLKSLEPKHSDAWRRLDVAVLQRYLLDEVLQPKFAGGRELTKTYVSDAKLVVPQTDGVKNQIAFLLQPTPLAALEELGKANEVMPAKSTYFYPKLATGMLINPLG